MDASSVLLIKACEPVGGLEVELEATSRMTALWGSGNTFEPLFCLRSWLIPVPTLLLQGKKKNLVSIWHSPALPVVFLFFWALLLRLLNHVWASFTIHISHSRDNVYTPADFFMLSLFFFLVYFFIEGWLLYRILLFSVIPQHESAIGIHISPPFWNSLPSPSILPLYIDIEPLFEFPGPYNKFPLAIYFIYGNISFNVTLSIHLTLSSQLLMATSSISLFFKTVYFS